MKLDELNSGTEDRRLDVGADGPVRVLVTDDQPTNIQVVGAMLGKLGYEIIPASDGPTALKRLAIRLPDLILLDVLMPGMDGVEVCRRIRANPEWNDIPIIFLSAADDKDLIVRALEAGGVDYVTKPFNHGEMVSRVRTHLALKATRDKLKSVAEDKDELIGILAHDLKNHLGGMQMSATLLRERMTQSGDARPAQLCENICHATGQLLAFVKEFLANSAADHGGFRAKSETVNLSDTVTRTVQDYREAARRKNIDIRMELPPQPMQACADRNALSQVLDNLLSNAVKFSSPGTQISVIVRSTPAGPECCVQDQGPGFTAEDRASMFRRYGRLSARPTGGEPSTGLGLSIVKKLVEAMKGEMICESAPGAGATFIIRLPRLPLSP
ncbi:MAG: two-component system, sensor histidine kinase and response regulator [Verrucomicrobiota bacterium]